MKRKATAIWAPIFLLPLVAFTAEQLDNAQATDRLPQPHYHPQPSDPAWLATVVQFHGHLGPSVVAGARMGMIGLRAVEAKGYFNVEVTCEGPLAKGLQNETCFKQRYGLVKSACLV
jgi:hypothetical protein